MARRDVVVRGLAPGRSSGYVSLFSVGVETAVSLRSGPEPWWW
ncbi:hypothetical protein [Phytoactinopolyspora limicola]|nr:hypothetical protein [Phytoactinopolyspora limicola]